MFTKRLLLLTTIILFTSIYTLAQDKDTIIVEDEEGVKDTIIIEEDEWEDEESWGDNGWDGDDWDRDWKDFHWDFNFMDDRHSKPAISLNYGLSKIMRDGFESEFGAPVLIEGKLGYSSERAYFGEGIAEYSYKFFRLSNISTELANKDFKDSELESSLWRFGFGREKGYGWKFGQSAIIPYNAYGFEWSRLEMKELPSSPGLIPLLPVFEEEADILNRYHEAFRFGTSAEAGVKFRLIAGITLEAAYERSIIFERHLFWKWAGSTVIEIAGQGLLDAFIDEIGDASPYVLPVMNFILKNALSYGIYELRQEKMNWPFDSAAPLSYDQFKFGLTFVF
ncbi:MAG: hypothetical protein R6W90_03865 [Ignavibacteriaceae bacterium]